MSDPRSGYRDFPDLDFRTLESWIQAPADSQNHENPLTSESRGHPPLSKAWLSRVQAPASQTRELLLWKTICQYANHQDDTLCAYDFGWHDFNRAGYREHRYRRESATRRDEVK